MSSSTKEYLDREGARVELTITLTEGQMAALADLVETFIETADAAELRELEKSGGLTALNSARGRLDNRLARYRRDGV